MFCSKRGEIEMWTEVVMGCSKKSEDGLENRVFRKNLMGRVKDNQLCFWREQDVCDSEGSAKC